MKLEIRNKNFISGTNNFLGLEPHVSTMGHVSKDQYYQKWQLLAKLKESYDQKMTKIAYFDSLVRNVSDLQTLENMNFVAGFYESNK